MNRHEKRKAAKLQPKLPTAKVCIGIPSAGMWHGKFGMDLLQMVLITLAHETPGYSHVDVVIKHVMGSTIWRQRSDIMQMAVDMECTHLLFVDTDQTFPSTTLQRLLSHKKEIVSCNIAVKKIPSCPTARRLVRDEAVMVFTTRESTGLEEVWRIGTGIMLIDLSIIPRLPQPWFKVSWGDESEQYGEDWWFCMLLERAKIPIWIDHDLSKEVGHIGLMEYQHFHVPQDLINIHEKLVADEKQKFSSDKVSQQYNDMLDERVRSM